MNYLSTQLSQLYLSQLQLSQLNYLSQLSQQLSHTTIISANYLSQLSHTADTTIISANYLSQLSHTVSIISAGITKRTTPTPFGASRFTRSARKLF